MTETSVDPQTQLLLRQHAQAVLIFVEKGMPAAPQMGEQVLLVGAGTGLDLDFMPPRG